MASNADTDMTTCADIKCWKAALKRNGFPRISYLHEMLRNELDKFKDNLPSTNPELKQYISTEIDDIFCQPNVYVIHVLRKEDRVIIGEFLKSLMKGEASYPSLCSVDELATSVTESKTPVVYIALLSESDMNEDCGQIIKMMKQSIFGEGAARKLLFVMNREVTSRSEIYNHINSLTNSHPEVSFGDECKGARVFYTEDEMLTKRISRQLENYVDTKIERVYKLCTQEDVLQFETLDKWKTTQKTENEEDETTIILVGNESTSSNEGPRNTPLSSSNFVTATKDGAKRIYQYYCDIAEECKDDVSIDVQISLSRIPGVKAFGFWKENFEISVSEEEWNGNHVHLLKDLQDATRGDKQISKQGMTEKDIHFRPSGKDVQVHLIVRESDKTCYGTITIWGNLEGGNEDQICFTAKHVVPEIKKEVRIMLEPCRHRIADCTCEPLSKGFCFYTHGVEDVNPLSDGLIDISCVKMSQQRPHLHDVSIPGPLRFAGRTILPLVQNFGGRKNKKVYKIGRNNQTVYGDYVGPWYIAPNETSQNVPYHWDCGHDHGVRIPLNLGPRKVDLIQHTNINANVPFGERGHSGALVCFIEDENNVSPAFVYLGKWPDTPNTYMCFRLREALVCLEQGQHLARFKLLFDDFRDVNPQGNT